MAIKHTPFGTEYVKGQFEELYPYDIQAQIAREQMASRAREAELDRQLSYWKTEQAREVDERRLALDEQKAQHSVEASLRAHGISLEDLGLRRERQEFDIRGREEIDVPKLDLYAREVAAREERAAAMTAAETRQQAEVERAARVREGLEREKFEAPYRGMTEAQKAQVKLDEARIGEMAAGRMSREDIAEADRLQRWGEFTQTHGLRQQMQTFDQTAKLFAMRQANERLRMEGRLTAAKIQNYGAQAAESRQRVLDMVRQGATDEMLKPAIVQKAHDEARLTAARAGQEEAKLSAYEAQLAQQTNGAAVITDEKARQVVIESANLEMGRFKNKHGSIAGKGVDLATFIGRPTAAQVERGQVTKPIEEYVKYDEKSEAAFKRTIHEIIARTPGYTQQQVANAIIMSDNFKEVAKEGVDISPDLLKVVIPWIGLITPQETMAQRYDPASVDMYAGIIRGRMTELIGEVLIERGADPKFLIKEGPLVPTVGAAPGG